MKKNRIIKTLYLGTACWALVAVAPALAGDVQLKNMPTEEEPMQVQPVAPVSAEPAQKEEAVAPQPIAQEDKSESLLMQKAMPVEPVMTAKPAAPKKLSKNPKLMTLRDAVAVGVATNPEYGIVANNRRATDEELRQAKSLYLPSLDFRGDTGYEYSDDPATRAGTDPNDEEELWRYDAGLTLTQLLFDGWETKYENERQKMRVLSASNRVREAEELVGLSVVQAYLEVLRQRELLKIARQNVAEHLSIMSQIEDSTAAGRSTQADVEQIKARVAAARAQEANTRQALRLAEADYIHYVGDPPKDLKMPMVPVEKLHPALDEQVKFTLHKSPTIDIYEADIEVAHAEFEGSKSTMYPQVDLQLNAREGKDLNGVRGRDTSASALMVVNWNLYRGGGDTARVREHINREAQAKEQRDKVAREVANDVRQTWARMITAGERARQFAAQADANAEVTKAYKDQFDLNRRTLLDVLDAQNEWFVSRSNTVNAEYLEIFAIYRLLALEGELLQALNVSYSRESDPAKM